MACGFLVQITENANSSDYHEETQSDKSGREAEEREVAGVVAPKEGELGNDEEYCSSKVSILDTRWSFEEFIVGTLLLTTQTSCDEVTACVEKEEFRNHKCLD